MQTFLSLTLLLLGQIVLSGVPQDSDPPTNPFISSELTVNYQRPIVDLVYKR